MGGQVESDGEALLPGGEVAAVEGVRILGGREAGILPDRPRPPGVHRGIGPARERGEAGKAGIEALDVLAGVERPHLDSFRRVPDDVLALHLLRGGGLPIGAGGFVGAQRISRVLRIRTMVTRSSKGW